MAAISAEQWLDNFNKALPLVVNDFKTKIVFDVHARQMARIFEFGGLGDTGTQRKQYSTRPMLSGRKNFVVKSGFTTIAGSKRKRRALKWVTLGSGETRKRLFVIPGGYKQFRQLQGRKTGFVNLDLSGALRIDWSASLRIVQGGLAAISSVKRGNNPDKMRGQLERYGNFNKFTIKEQELQDNEVSKSRIKHGI